MLNKYVGVVVLNVLLFAGSSVCVAQDQVKEAQKKQGMALATAEGEARLTRAEKADGWKLLFDGRTTAGWRGFRRTDFPETGWVVEDGSLKHQAGQRGGDIITTEQYDNFELQLEWRLAPGANSGIKYLVSETLPKPGQAAIAFEMQVIDDISNPDIQKSKDERWKTGGLYELFAPQVKTPRPVTEWNQARLVVRGNHVEHWLNGAKVVEYEIGSERLKAAVAKSKFKDVPGFGEIKKGHLLLQDHGDEVWFRNIKLRELRR